jgi:hypothetical protein
VKAKKYRVHYARKQLHKDDPDRYCRRNAYVLMHEVEGPIMSLLTDFDKRSVKYTGFCRHCNLRIESWYTSEMSYRPSWSEMEWRVERYIIEELPY